MITPKEFVEVWMDAFKKGESQSWVATKTGVSRQLVSQRAKYYRLRGINLPQLTRGKGALQVDELNKIIEEHK